MKIQLQFATVLAVMLMISNTFPVYAMNADGLPEVSASPQDNILLSDRDLSEEWKTVSSGDPFLSSDGTPTPESYAAKAEESDPTVLDKAPMFSAYVELFHGQGYFARGIFTEFLPDTSLVTPLYSLDGEVWQTCQTTWNLQWLGSENADDLKKLQNQTCLYSNQEPLAGYLAGQLDRFYLKLQITLENGVTYETQAAVIDRGDPQPLPDEFTPVASFVPDMLIRQWRPFKRYGQYQLTVSANATQEEISALLPETLPIEIQLYDGINMVTNAIVDCPVTWNPLSLSGLTAGESVTIENAAEKIVVPAGTLLNTPNGIFQLEEPLDMEYDEIRLILNAVAENAELSGALACEINGLQIVFHLKPTGATAIRAYTLSEGESDWVELPAPLLPEEVNAPSSAANSTYTFVLKNTSEPYQSYLAAWNAGDEPVPFLVGLKIEGGVYDGRQLILAWPDTYELPSKVPDLNGSGGNECNAGSDNKDDSTPEGQRPNLPQNPTDEQDAQNPQPPGNPTDEQDTQNPQPPKNPTDEQDTQVMQPPGNPTDEQDAQVTQPPGNPTDQQDAQVTQPPENPTDQQDAQVTQPPENPTDQQDTQVTQPPENPTDQQDTQVSQPPGNPTDQQDTQVTQPPGNPTDQQDAQVTQLPQNSEEKQNTQAPELHQIPKNEQNVQESKPQQTTKDGQDVQAPKLQQLPEYQQEVQLLALYIPEAKPEGQPGGSQTVGEQQPKLSQIGLHRLFLTAAATIVIGIGIIVTTVIGKTGSMSGSISGKNKHPK